MHKANVLVCTGNILLNNDLKRKIYATSTEEFIDSMLWTLEHSCHTKILNHTNNDVTTEDAKSRDILVVDPAECCKSQTASGSTRTTCKLFPICNTNCTIVQDAILCAFKYLDVEAIDSLILAPSPKGKDSNDSPLRSGTLREWQLAEGMVDDGLVKSLGTSDFDLNSLRYLFDKIRIKPVSNQISKQLCCSIPTDLTEFAEKNSIQLLTHNDRMEILDKTEIEQLEKNLVKFLQTDHSYTLEWLLRYSVMIGSKGIIDKKGYMAKFKRVDIQ